MATPGTPNPAEVGPKRLWLIAVLFGLVSSLVLGTTVVLVTRSSGSAGSVGPATTESTDATGTTGTTTGPADDAITGEAVPGRVVLIGDSITEQTEDTFESVLGSRWSLWIDGVGGATVAQQMSAAERGAAESPQQVVVELGTNDVGRDLDPATSVALVRSMLDLFPTATCLHVVTVTEGMSLDGRDHRADAAAFNDGLRALAEADPRLTVIEWDDALAAEEAAGVERTDLLYDTVHLTDRGEQLLAGLYADALQACPAG